MKVNPDPLKCLVASTDIEVNACFQINRSHLECTGAQRQNVNLTVKLLSDTTATALKVYQPSHDKKLAMATGIFIEKMSVWFNVFNSLNINASLISKRPWHNALSSGHRRASPSRGKDRDDTS